MGLCILPLCIYRPLEFPNLKLKALVSRRNGCQAPNEKGKMAAAGDLPFAPRCGPGRAGREVEVREAGAEQSLFPFSAQQQPPRAAAPSYTAKALRPGGRGLQTVVCFLQIDSGNFSGCF